MNETKIEKIYGPLGTNAEGMEMIISSKEYIDKVDRIYRDLYPRSVSTPTHFIPDPPSLIDRVNQLEVLVQSLLDLHKPVHTHESSS